MIEVGLDGVATAGGRILISLRLATESLAEFGGAAIGDVGDLPRDSHPGDRRATTVVIAAAIVGITFDGGELRGTPSDLVRGEGCAGGDGDGPAHHRGIHDGPLEDPHPSHRAAD